MSASQSVTISINNVEYTIRADIAPEILHRAVAELNERIDRLRSRSHLDELRATVLTALGLATEFHEIQRKNQLLEEELAFLKEETSRITSRVTRELDKL